MPIPTTNLLMDLKAGVGITASGGRISAWAPQAGSITDPCTQATGALQPYDDIDGDGNPCVAFPWGYPTHPACRLAVPASISVSSRAVTVWVVAAVHASFETACFLALTGTTNPVLANYPAAAGNPTSPYSQGKYSPVTSAVPVNKSLIGAVCDNLTNGMKLYANDQVSSATAAGSATLSGGGFIGTNNSGGIPFSGRLYRMLVYGVAQTQTDIDATRAALIEEYGLVMTYTKQIIVEGDSLTEGLFNTNGANWPMRLDSLKANYRVWNTAKRSAQVGTAGTEMMADYATQADILWNAGMENHLVMLGGTNDIQSAATAATVWDRLKAYAAQARAAKTWNSLRVITLLDRTGAYKSTVAAANVLIRTGDANISHIIDIGAGSATEARLSDAANTTYFHTDGLHTIDAGAQVIADGVEASFAPTVSSFIPGFFAAF